MNIYLETWHNLIQFGTFISHFCSFILVSNIYLSFLLIYLKEFGAFMSFFLFFSCSYFIIYFVLFPVNKELWHVLCAGIPCIVHWGVEKHPSISSDISTVRATVRATVRPHTIHIWMKISSPPSHKARLLWMDILKI